MGVVVVAVSGRISRRTSGPGSGVVVMGGLVGLHEGCERIGGFFNHFFFNFFLGLEFFFNKTLIRIIFFLLSITFTNSFKIYIWVTKPEKISFTKAVKIQCQFCYQTKKKH